jgi:two-component system nitrogen regulation sensor histidine kinase NtrY
MAAKRARRWIWRGLAFAVLVGIVFILGSINVPFLAPDEPSEVILLYVFSGIVFLAFIIYGLVLIRYLARLYIEQRRQVLGTKFKTKMVAGALALSLLPVIALFFLSYAMLNRTLAKWFPRPLEVVRDDAAFLVQHILRNQEDQARAVAAALAAELDLQQPMAAGNPEALKPLLGTFIERHQLPWAAVVDTEGRLLAVRHAATAVDFRSALPQLVEPRGAFARTLSLQVGDSYYSLARVRVETARGQPLGSVVVAQALPAAAAGKLAEIERESAAYESLKSQRKSYRWQALLILLLITVLVMLASTWAALHLSRQVIVPIQALAVATEEVSRGNFDYRVDVPAQDELGILVRSFNQMTGQLGESLRNLERAIAELESRRQWIETILDSIPTGVLTLSSELAILDANDGATALLGEGTSEGAHLPDLLSGEAKAECARLFERASSMGFASCQVEFRLTDRIAHVAATASALRREGRNEGYVLVLDDLTDLLKAEKVAAWQEVAQRMAHEIKNPLTPIQLSADRIRRYLERTAHADPGERARSHELIAQCATLIAQEVQALKALVNEFSNFARFPIVKPVPTQLNELVGSVLGLYAEGLNGIQLTSELAPELPPISGDPALLRRVLVNLIDNAADAAAQADAKQIFVRTQYVPARGRVELSVADSGPGISAENKERLFLPFFSTKPKGMGLGLAIVSRIIAEHHGQIRVEDNLPHGTRFVMEFPAAAAAVA